MTVHIREYVIKSQMGNSVKIAVAVKYVNDRLYPSSNTNGWLREMNI